MPLCLRLAGGGKCQPPPSHRRLLPSSLACVAGLMSAFVSEACAQHPNLKCLANSENLETLIEQVLFQYWGTHAAAPQR